MGIDAIALLNIPKLPAPRLASGAEIFVEHRGRASLVHTFDGFNSRPADEHALALRRLLGAALDAHDDARGILFFPDVAEPKGRSYDAIVLEVESVGVWAPKVDLDHVPSRYAEATPETHEGLVSKLIAKLGRDAGTQLDMMVQVHLQLLQVTGNDAQSREELDAALAQVDQALGPSLRKAYEASVERKLESQRLAQDAHFGRALDFLGKKR